MQGERHERQGTNTKRIIKTARESPESSSSGVVVQYSPDDQPLGTKLPLLEYHEIEAGEGSRFPALSTAATWKVWTVLLLRRA